MLHKIQTRLEFKILLLIIAVLIAGFGAYVVISIQSEADAMLQSYENSMFVYSETVVAGIRNMMMTGKTPLTNEFLNDARKNLSFGSLTIYDRFGREVFLREGEGVIYNVDDSYLKATLSTRQTQTTMMKDSSEEVYTRFEPLLNQPECWRCHEKEPPLRGVIQLAIKPSMMRTTNANEAAKQMAGAMGQVVATAFRTIMLGGQGEQMDTLTAKASEIPSVARVQVYSKDAYVAFGPESDDVNEETVAELIEQQAKDPRFEELGKKLRLFIPLQNEERCQVCHGMKFPMRGVMVVDFYSDSLKQYLRDPAKLFTWALQSAAYEGFRSIMLVGRANSTRYYIDGVRAIPEIHSVHVFDREGNERFLNPKPRKREELATIITAKEKKPMEFLETVDGEQFMVRLSPIRNEVRCYTCHGKNHDLRAVVEVSGSMKSINEQIKQRKLTSLGAAIVTILLVWMVIRLFMNTVVVKPVQIIEGVASRVGRGDFSAQANVASKDEIGVLALRINEMVQGLRERFHLQKFVSQQTVNAVRLADNSGVRLGGERKIATVFFSDIRGFTAYSEKVDPERVVAMLNTCLAGQSAIVKKYGGDIDKFVGDELVAMFEGETMVERAVKAALEIQEVIKNSPDIADKDVINIGIGINTGEMVMGAMGSPERMDYTVIGDNVNLGARLCSAAKGGEILISDSSYEHVKDQKEFELKQLESIVVKGKEKPVTIYAVRWNNQAT